MPVRIHTVWYSPLTDSVSTCWNVANCQSSGFHAGIGSPKTLM